MSVEALNKRVDLIPYATGYVMQLTDDDVNIDWLTAAEPFKQSPLDVRIKALEKAIGRPVTIGFNISGKTRRNLRRAVFGHDYLKSGPGSLPNLKGFDHERGLI